MQLTKTKDEKFTKSSTYLNGFKNYELFMQEHIDVTQSKMVRCVRG